MMTSEPWRTRPKCAVYFPFKVAEPPGQSVLPTFSIFSDDFQKITRCLAANFAVSRGRFVIANEHVVSNTASASTSTNGFRGGSAGCLPFSIGQRISGNANGAASLVGSRVSDSGDDS